MKGDMHGINPIDASMRMRNRDICRGYMHAGYIPPDICMGYMHMAYVYTPIHSPYP